jgi:hypothetical protein
MPFVLETAWQEISKGDAGAAEFCRTFYAWTQSFDDLIDRDKSLRVDEAVLAQVALLANVATSSFVQANRDTLLPVISVSALAYIASEDRKNNPDVVERMTAQVLKSEYVNVFLTVALIVGGWEHALTMSRRYREYNFDVEPVKV